MIHCLSYTCCCVFNYQQEQAPIPGWTTQSNVPDCIVSHLTFVQFKGYRELPDELLFAECILQNGTVLKTMSIMIGFLSFGVNPFTIYFSVRKKKSKREE